jgi:hypothetical protein
MPAKTPNALLHGTLDALILETLDRGAARRSSAFPRPGRIEGEGRCDRR